MSAVHDKYRFCAASERSIDELSPVSDILYNTLYWCGFGTDGGDDALSRDHVAESDIDQFHRRFPLFDVLDLLTDLFDLGFHIHHKARDLQLLTF